MADSHLKVIPGGNTPSEAPGSESWSESVRADAKQLAGNLDEGYMELARLLWQIYDTPIGGDPHNAPIYTKWGYTTFGDYVEEELGIHRKKAQRLRRIWYNLEIRLGDSLDADLKKRIVALGMSKVRDLVGVLTPRNAEKWVEKAEELSFPQLSMAIRQYREERTRRAEEKSVGEAAGGENPFDREGSGGQGEGGDGLPPPVDSVIGESLDDPEIPVPDFEPDDQRIEKFSLFPEQHDIVMQALDVAQRLSNSQVKSQNLHLVCLDFLATNGDGKTTKQQKLRRLTQLAKLYGYDLVIVEDEDVVFGIDTLERLAKGL